MNNLGWCILCQKKVNMIDPILKYTVYGQRYIVGTCSECKKTKVMSFLKTVKKGGNNGKGI